MRRSPSPRFDRTFYVAEQPPGLIHGDPFLHLLTRQDSTRVPANELEKPQAVPRSAAQNILVIHHARGGGSMRFLSIFEGDLVAQGFNPIRLRCVPESDRLLVCPQADGAWAAFDLTTDFEALLAYSRSRDISRILVSHVVDLLPEVIFSILGRLAEALQVRMDVILHDYFCLCPRINLVTSDGRPCGIAPPAVCVTCVGRGGGDIGRANVTQWRVRFLEFLSLPDRVFVPSEDMKRRLSPYISRPLVVWNPEPTLRFSPRPISLRADETLNICVIGNLNVAKGRNVIAGLALASQKARAPIVVHVFGECEDPASLRSAGVVLHGRYVEDDLERMLRESRPHVAFLPAIWPETWSFVLTRALQFGLNVVAFAHGAPAERLRREGMSDMLLPTFWIEDPERVLAFFLELRRRYVHRSSGE